MRIEGIGEHVGYVKPDIARDIVDENYFVDDNERADVFGENILMKDEDDILTFFSGDDASVITFTATIHFFDKTFETWEFNGELFQAGIFDSKYIHYWSSYNRICGVWIEFEGDFNGGFAALDRIIKVAEKFNLPYEYEANICYDSKGNYVQFDDDTRMVYRSPQLSAGLLTYDELELLINKGYVARFTANDVKIQTPDNQIMTFKEYTNSLK